MTEKAVILQDTLDLYENGKPHYPDGPATFYLNKEGKPSLEYLEELAKLLESKDNYNR